MNRRRNVYVGVSVATLVVVLTVVQLLLQTKTAAQGIQAGVYESAPFWPKQLPNHWVFGSVVGLAVDSRDHIWVVHRGKATIDPNLGAMMAYPPAASRGAETASAPGRHEGFGRAAAYGPQSHQGLRHPENVPVWRQARQPRAGCR